MPTTGGFNWEKWLPLILAGGQTVGSILGTRAQNNALDKSSEIQSQGNKDALAALLGMWNVQRNDLAPYRKAGKDALPELYRLTYRGRPGTPTAPPPSDDAPLPQSIQNLMAGRPASSGGVGGSPSVSSLLSNNGVKGPGLGAGVGSMAAGTIGSMIAGGGIPGLAGLPVASGLGAAMGLGSLAGPIGAGVGALTGLLINRLGRRGREKEAASGAVNEFSDWFWKDIVPKFRAGEIDQATLQAAAKQGWNDYSSWLDTTLGDKTVAARSRDSQRNYFNQGLSQFGFQV